MSKKGQSTTKRRQWFGLGRGKGPEIRGQRGGGVPNVCKLFEQWFNRQTKRNRGLTLSKNKRNPQRKNPLRKGPNAKREGNGAERKKGLIASTLKRSSAEVLKSNNSRIAGPAAKCGTTRAWTRKETGEEIRSGGTVAIPISCQDDLGRKKMTARRGIPLRRHGPLFSNEDFPSGKGKKKRRAAGEGGKEFYDTATDL